LAVVVVACLVVRDVDLVPSFGSSEGSGTVDLDPGDAGPLAGIVALPLVLDHLEIVHNICSMISEETRVCEIFVLLVLGIYPSPLK
jgi:hypothetical protein